MRNNHHISVIIPMLNEADTIEKVVGAIPDWVDDIIVADNGSTDGSPQIATNAGATVVHEPRRGYGAACLAAMKYIAQTGTNAAHTIVVFLDGDFSDDPTEMASLVDPITAQQVLFVLGSRVSGNCEKGALTIPQRFGNWLACALLQLFFKMPFTDLGPFRAIRFDALAELNMDDQDFGWTVQMQARAAILNIPTIEVPVRYRNRDGGKSKVSGTVRGVYGAGTTILRVILKEALRDALKQSASCTGKGTQYSAD